MVERAERNLTLLCYSSVCPAYAWKHVLCKYLARLVQILERVKMREKAERMSERQPLAMLSRGANDSVLLQRETRGY